MSEEKNSNPIKFDGSRKNFPSFKLKVTLAIKAQKAKNPDVTEDELISMIVDRLDEKTTTWLEGEAESKPELLESTTTLMEALGNKFRDPTPITTKHLKLEECFQGDKSVEAYRDEFLELSYGLGLSQGELSRKFMSGLKPSLRFKLIEKRINIEDFDEHAAEALL